MSTKKHTIYVINTSESGKSYWNRAGVAFGNRDGSFTFKLDILPQTKFQLREEKPAREEEPPPSSGRARDNQGALPWLSWQTARRTNSRRKCFAVFGDR